MQVIPADPGLQLRHPSLALRVKDLDEEQRNRYQTGVMLALKMRLDLKDLRTGLHAARLADRAVRVALQSGHEELRDIEFASLLHDVSKIGVPDARLSDRRRTLRRQEAPGVRLSDPTFRTQFAGPQSDCHRCVKGETRSWGK